MTKIVDAYFRLLQRLVRRADHFDRVDNKMRIAQEEVFGPVLCDALTIHCLCPEGGRDDELSLEDRYGRIKPVLGQHILHCGC
jgi:hypothetical protein